MAMINLIDVGALGGLEYPWSAHKNEVGCVLSFEPNEAPAVSENRIKLDTAIWDSDGEETLHIYGRGGKGSSLLRQNVKWVQDHRAEIQHQGDPKLANSWLDRSEELSSVRVRTRRLDTVMHDLRHENTTAPDRFHFLKSDTQSGESFVIEGARNYLCKEALGVELELFRYPLYEGMILEEEVKRIMRELGFEVAGWTGYKNSFLSQCDVLFLKHSPRDEEERQILNTIRTIYGATGPDSIIKKMPFARKVLHKASRAIQLLGA